MEKKEIDLLTRLELFRALRDFNSANLSGDKKKFYDDFFCEVRTLFQNGGASRKTYQLLFEFFVLDRPVFDNAEDNLSIEIINSKGFEEFFVYEFYKSLKSKEPFKTRFYYLTECLKDANDEVFSKLILYFLKFTEHHSGILNKRSFNYSIDFYERFLKHIPDEKRLDYINTEEVLSDIKNEITSILKPFTKNSSYAMTTLPYLPDNSLKLKPIEFLFILGSFFHIRNTEDFYHDILRIIDKPNLASYMTLIGSFDFEEYVSYTQSCWIKQQIKTLLDVEVKISFNFNYNFNDFDLDTQLFLIPFFTKRGLTANRACLNFFSDDYNKFFITEGEEYLYMTEDQRELFYLEFKI